MFKRKSFSFRGKRFGRPVAHVQFLWCTTRLTLTETAGTVSTFALLAASQWANNATSGNSQRASLVRVIWSVRTTQVATGETRVFTLTLDDQNALPSNPDTVAAYSDQDTLHWGLVSVPAVSSTVAQHNSGITPVEATHDTRLRRRMREDQEVFLNLSPAAAAANQLSLTVLARTLVRIG